MNIEQIAAIARAVCMSPQRVTRILERLPPFTDDTTFAVILHRVRREANAMRIEDARGERLTRIDDEMVRIKVEMMGIEAINKERRHAGSSQSRA